MNREFFSLLSTMTKTEMGNVVPLASDCAYSESSRSEPIVFRCFTTDRQSLQGLLPFFNVLRKRRRVTVESV